jgi:hypothetical protein
MLIVSSIQQGETIAKNLILSKDRYQPHKSNKIQGSKLDFNILKRKSKVN